MLKQKKGITLIALVITIIVLLILAGVAITAISGEDGILTNATRAKEDTRASTLMERISMWQSNKKVDKYLNEDEALTEDEFLSKCVTEDLLTESEKTELKNNRSVVIGSKTVTIPNTLDVVIQPFSRKSEFYYSFDEGATWTKVQNREIHISNFENDMILFVIGDDAGESGINWDLIETDETTGTYIPDWSPTVEPDYSEEGYGRVNSFAVHFPKGQNVNLTFKMTLFN